MKRLIPLGLVVGAGAFLALSAPFWPLVARFLPPCLFRTLTGVPCPTCGTTHAFLALAHGDLAAALASNPLVVVASAGAAALAVFWAALAALGKPLPRGLAALETRWPRWLRLAAVLALAANWLWVARHS